MPKTLVLSYPGCIMFEVMLACELLSKAYPVEVATPDGHDHSGTTGMIFRAQKSFTEINVHDYKCVLIPGGDTYEVMDNTTLDEILHLAYAQNIPVGAICAGPLILAKAGILRNKSFTHGFGEHHKEFLAPYWQGAQYLDQPVVICETLVTAKPEAHVDFGVAIAQLARAIKDDDTANYYRNYYKGNRSSTTTGAVI